MSVHRQSKRDPVTPELVEALTRRDIGCVLSFLDEGHVCRNQWGDTVAWTEATTVEHVKSLLRMGRRAPSDLGHTVLLCAGSNIAVPSKRERGLIRDYLASRAA